jgi:hypothetical protein
VSETWEELRDLASNDKLASEHKASSMVRKEIYVLVEHLQLRAAVHEMNARENRRVSK